MMRPFAHPVVCCYVLLGVIAQSLKASYVQTDATTPKIVGLTMLGVVMSVLAEVYKRTRQHQTLLAQQF